MTDFEPVKKAVETLTVALSADPDYWISWQANIAMAFVDEVARHRSVTGKRCINRREIHAIANTAADNFLKLLVR